MKEFFQTKFGQILKRNSTKLSRKDKVLYRLDKTIKGTSLKKGHYYYLDNLHLDHIEVFDRSGIAKGVYNLDGTFNSKKSLSALAQGRKINIK